MHFRFNQAFKYSVALLLIITAAAKLVASGSQERILELPDPIFLISLRYMLWIGSGMELVVALVCLSAKQTWMQSTAIAWLATNLLLYRISLWLVGYHQPCLCLGRLTDGIRMSPATTDTIIKVVLAYLLVGSYATLFWLWRQRKKANSAPGSAQL
jgi:hypothetical protein